MMLEGAMRHVIDIQAQRPDLDAFGQQILVWNTFVKCRAAVVRVSGREVFEAAHRAARVPVVFRMRWRAGVAPKMRLIFDGRVHNILSVTDPDGLKEQLLILTEELVGDVVVGGIIPVQPPTADAKLFAFVPGVNIVLELLAPTAAAVVTPFPPSIEKVVAASTASAALTAFVPDVSVGGGTVDVLAPTASAPVTANTPVVSVLAGAIEVLAPTAPAPVTANVPTVVVVTTVVSDNFNRVNASTLGANWTALTGVVQPSIASNQATRGAAASAAYWSANTFTENQFSAATIPAPTSLPQGVTRTAAELIVRAASGAQTYYAAVREVFGDPEFGDQFSVNLYRVIAGARSLITSVGDPSPTNNFWRIEATKEGADVRIIVKSKATSGGIYSTVISVKDINVNKILGGQPGISFVPGAATNNCDDWSGGSI